MSAVTRILQQLESGDSSSARQLLPLVYEELRKLAADRLANEKPGQLLQATALVHEAYLRLTGDAQDIRWDSRGHFFAAAAEAMRRILIDQARAQQRLKRGGGHARRIDLNESQFISPAPREDLLDLDAALDKLAVADRAAAELVQLRHFAGLTIRECAEVLGISPRSTDRLWAYARAWLYQELYGTDAPESSLQ